MTTPTPHDPLVIAGKTYRSRLLTGTGKFTISPIASGTRFEWTEELIFPWWMGGPLAGIVGGQVVMKAIWRRNLRELKKIVEAR